MPLSKDAIDRTIKQLRKEEGYRRFPYMDTKGNETVGIGLNLKSRGLSESEALVPLLNDILDYYNKLDIQLSFFNKLDEVRKVVLVDMAFNMGDGGLFGFKKMLHALSMGDFKGAATEMKNSQWYKDVESDRGDRLINMMISGNWPSDIG